MTVSHETVPGHHLQIATARALRDAGRFADVNSYTAYVEGSATMPND
jgi:uncharacterized protein (DUF885 family)